MLSSATGLWFVSAYFYLYCLSPILNAYLKGLTAADFRKYLVCFLFLETVVGWLLGSQTFNHVILFMLIYSVGYYLGKAGDERLRQLSLGKCVAGWFAVTCLIFVFLYFPMPGPLGNLCYNNPFVLLQAVMVLLVFTKVRMKHSKRVNYLAQSALMVYLMSENLHTRGYFVELVQTVCRSVHGAGLVVALTFLFIFLFFALLLLDKVISKIYNPVWHWIVSVLNIK